jgi:hypothetical protein
MKTTIKIKGKIVFDPPEVTGKHKKQADWKKVAYVLFKGDICKYYQWFIFKRYGLILVSPLRGPHVTFINDSRRDMGKNINKWEQVKRKWNSKTIEITLSLDVRSDGTIWWMVVPEQERGQLHAIRAELGLDRPYFGLHMTIGNAVDCHDKIEVDGINIQRAIRKNEDHSKYIHGLLVKGLIK